MNGRDFEILGRDAAALRRLNRPTARSVVMQLATYGTIVHKNRRSPRVTGRNARNHEHRQLRPDGRVPGGGQRGSATAASDRVGRPNHH